MHVVITEEFRILFIAHFHYLLKSTGHHLLSAGNAMPGAHIIFICRIDIIPDRFYATTPNMAPPSSLKCPVLTV
jgi:hypothetical protein